MAKNIINPNSTLDDVASRLLKAGEYVLGVFNHMYECRKKMGTSYVRIGVTGEGKVPHYRIEYDVVDQKYPIPIYDAFNGWNHEKLVDEDVLRDGNWSTRRMDFDEVVAVLTKVRTPEKPKI